MKHLKTAVLQAFLDRELTEPRRIRAESHLTRCAGCRGMLAGLKNIHAEVRTKLTVLSPDQVPSVEFRSEPAGDESVKKAFPLRQLVFASIRVPAILVVLIGAAGMILAGLYYSETKNKDTNQTLSSDAAGPSLIMILPEREVSLSLGFSPEAFKPVENPVIFKEI